MPTMANSIANHRRQQDAPAPSVLRSEMGADRRQMVASVEPIPLTIVSRISEAMMCIVWSPQSEAMPGDSAVIPRRGQALTQSPESDSEILELFGWIQGSHCECLGMTCLHRASRSIIA